MISICIICACAIWNSRTNSTICVLCIASQCKIFTVNRIKIYGNDWISNWMWRIIKIGTNAVCQPFKIWRKIVYSDETNGLSVRSDRIRSINHQQYRRDYLLNLNIVIAIETINNIESIETPSLTIQITYVTLPLVLTHIKCSRLIDVRKSLTNDAPQFPYHITHLLHFIRYAYLTLYL